MQRDDEEGTVARMTTNSTEQWPADEGSAELKKGVAKGGGVPVSYFFTSQTRH